MFFCGGCRYRVTAYRDWPVYKVKQALFSGGIARANKPEGVRNTPGIRGWEDLVRCVQSCEHLKIAQSGLALIPSIRQKRRR